MPHFPFRDELPTARHRMEQLERENRDLHARVRQLTREAKAKPSFLSLLAGVAIGFIVGLWLVMH